MGAAVPVTNKFRLELNPFFSKQVSVNLQYESVNANYTVDYADDSRVWYTGFHLKGIFDNTEEQGFNIYKGLEPLLNFNIINHFPKISRLI